MVHLVPDQTETSTLRLSQGLTTARTGPPVRQVVARLVAVRVVQGHRGGTRSARIARSTQATASHARDEPNRVTIQLIGTDYFAHLIE